MEKGHTGGREAEEERERETINHMFIFKMPLVNIIICKLLKVK